MATNNQPLTDADLRALLNSAPVGGASQVPPIGGMPSSYVAQVQPPDWVHRDSHVTNVPVQYFEGDEWVPANSTPQDIARLQQQMIEGGLIPKGSKYHLGVWDDTTRTAFKDALAYANATGMNAQMALTTLATNKPSVVPTTKLVPDIASAAQTVKDTLNKKLGRDATPEEVRNLSNVLMGFDQKAYDAQQQAQVGDGATVTNVDPTAEFNQYLENQYQPEIQRDAAVGDLTKSRTTLLNNIFAMDKAIGAQP